MARLSSLTPIGTRFIAGAFAFVLGTGSGVALADPFDLEVSTDFEEFDVGTPTEPADFTVGTGDVSARFTDGWSGVAGVFELYNSGTHAWMVTEGDTGEIRFETDAAVVEFFARTLSTADGTSVLTAFDNSNDQVGDAITLNPGDAFQLVSFTGAIDRIEFVNNATCTGCMNSIDDFGFSPVPIPAAVWLFGSSLLGLVGLVKRKSKSV